MKRIPSLISLIFMASLAMPAHAAPVDRRVCVFDIVGNVGPLMNAMRDWRAEALNWGVNVELRPYTNEAIAAEELQGGGCDAALLTGIRARNFHSYAGTIDSVGATPTMDHMRLLLQVLAHPQQASKLSSGTYGILGVAPAGAVHLFVNDREINNMSKAAGKRVAVLEYDPTQEILVSQVGASPVLSDITNFSTRFNNGSVDVIVAPLVAYGPLELHRGLSPDGGIIDYPLTQMTIQLVARNDRFSAEFAAKSREYFYDNIDTILAQVEQEEAQVDPKWWVPIPEEDKAEYEVMMAEAREQMQKLGYYDADMLALLSRIRCRLDDSRAECTQ